MLVYFSVTTFDIMANSPNDSMEIHTEVQFPPFPMGEEDRDFDDTAAALVRDMARQERASRAKSRALININLCPLDALKNIKGVGSRRAEKIISVRSMMHKAGLSLTRENLVSFKLGLSDDTLNQFSFMEGSPTGPVELGGPGEEGNLAAVRPEVRFPRCDPSNSDFHLPASGAPLANRSTRSDFQSNRSDFSATDGHRIRRHVSLPKGLNFDGSGCFSTFREKFRKYLFREDFADEDTGLYALSLALQGRASDFFERTCAHKRFSSVTAALDVLRSRFDTGKNWRAASLQLHSASQRDDESSHDFEDRLWALGHQAYPQGSAEQVEREVLHRFILGLRDKGAVQHLSLQGYNTVREAADGLKIYEYSVTVSGIRSRAVRCIDTPMDHVVRQVSHSCEADTDHDDVSDLFGVRQVMNKEPMAKHTEGGYGYPKSPVGSGSSLQRIESALSDLSKSLKEISTTMAEMKLEITNLKKSNGEYGSRSRVTFQDRRHSPAPFQDRKQQDRRNPSSSPSRGCFVCGSPNHFKSSCPKVQSYKNVRCIHDDVDPDEEDFRLGLDQDPQE